MNFLTDKINSEGRFYAINCSLATLKGITDDDRALTRIVSLINKSMLSSPVQSIISKAYKYNSLPPMADSSTKVSYLLNQLCEDLDKDLIVFFDEADCLSGPGLITFLAQIRDAYQIRETPGKNKFPRSMALVGLRDLRDYVVEVGGDTSVIGSGSPFNITQKALTLTNFTRDEIKTLYLQHTEASGQIFEDKAIIGPGIGQRANPGWSTPWLTKRWSNFYKTTTLNQ
ncbi:MAG: hypothetical protein LBT86_04690 [Deltaproteobacteria bacterium]|nr:hypothetical protein [Deltaproteobacteria bacterium]